MMFNILFEQLGRSARVDRTEKINRGKSFRKEVPRDLHSEWSPRHDRPDPFRQLQAIDKKRLQDLLPVKYGRMLTSPFAFLRGSAVVMASDLATMPILSGLFTQLCGDAHLANFGLFASRERNLIFDVNDFDETYPGPWDWDLKRLAVSIVLAGRENGFSDASCKEMVQSAVRVYRQFMEKITPMHAIDVWRIYIDAAHILSVFEKSFTKSGRKHMVQATTKARTNTREQSLAKLTRVVGDTRQIISTPPLIASFNDLLVQRIHSDFEREKISLDAAKKSFKNYLDSLKSDRQHLLSRFKIVDGGLRVGGVGSVGTRCLIVLLQGDGPEEALILQLKEASSSVLERHLPKVEYASHAERVVHGQRLMQATSDVFLGWGHRRLRGIYYYWRQFKDMKGSLDVTLLDKQSFAAYMEMCSICLARAHGRAGNPAGIFGYLGTSDKFDRAIAEFAIRYADQTERDFKELQKQRKLGKIKVESGV